MANVFFSTCSSNSADDYVVDGDDDVDDADGDELLHCVL